MSGLTIRHFERREVELPVEFIISEAHQEQVRFSTEASAIGPHSVAATTIDISFGGLGLRTQQFIPRMCEGRLRVFDPKPVGRRSDGSPMLEVAFEHDVKVRRVSMIGHEPSYFVGVSFVEPGPDLEQRILKLWETVCGELEGNRGSANAVQAHVGSRDGAARNA